MKTQIKIISGLAAALALSACTATTSNDDITATGPATGVSGATIASRYNATLATDGKTLAQADAASVAANGGFATEGYRLSTLRGSAAYKTQVIGNDLEFTVDGSTFRFTNAKLGDDLTGRKSTNGVLEFIGGPVGTYSEVGGGIKRPVGNPDKAVIGVRGLQTQVANLPTSQATYEGKFTAIAFENGAGTTTNGDFSAEVDFGAAKSVKGTFMKDGVKLGTLNGAINGNAFSGTTALKLTGTGPTGLIASSGNFFGPTAEEITGVANGKVGTAEVAAGFLGTKK